MENPMEGYVYKPADKQRDEVTQHLEQELHTASSDLDLLSDGQAPICTDSTSDQRLPAAKYAYARLSAFLSLDSDEEDTDGTSSLYSRPSHRLEKAAPHAPQVPEKTTPHSLVISTPSGHDPSSSKFSRKLHQMPPTPNSRREVSFWSKTSSAISCIPSDYYDQCSICSEYDGVDGLIQCQCGNCYCYKCAKDLLLKAALADVFRPPCCFWCGQHISLDFFLPCIDPEMESPLREKYNDSPQPSTFKEMPKGSSQKWKQSQPFHRLAHYIFDCGQNSLSDARPDAKERRDPKTWHYLDSFRKYTPDAQPNHIKCRHGGLWYTVYSKDPCNVCTRPSATHLCKCHHCGVLMCPGCRQREIGVSKRIIMPNFPNWTRVSAVFD